MNVRLLKFIGMENYQLYTEFSSLAKLVQLSLSYYIISSQ